MELQEIRLAKEGVVAQELIETSQVQREYGWLGFNRGNCSFRGNSDLSQEKQLRKSVRLHCPIHNDAAEIRAKLTGKSNFRIDDSLSSLNSRADWTPVELFRNSISKLNSLEIAWIAEN